METEIAGNAGSIGSGVADVIARAEAEGIDLHSVLVVQGGAVAAEAYRAPFDAGTPHRMYSVTKSFTSSAIGLAVAEGRLTVDDRVVDIFPERAPYPIPDQLAELRVRHLLTMSAEHAMVPESPTARPRPTVAQFLAEPLALPPGSRFEYSNPCSYMLAAIVERVTGEELPAYLKPRLLDPLGIPARPWLRSDEGIANGGWGMHLTTRELARFGQLYLQRGMWEGTRLLPEAWIDEATGARVKSWHRTGFDDWLLGYGYQFWRGRHETYRADGMMGQFAIVLPAYDAVVVTTAGVLTTQPLLDLVWGHILPALANRDTSERGAFPAFPTQPEGLPGPPAAATAAGQTFVLGEPFVLPTRFYGGQVAITSAGFEVTDGEIALILSDRGARYRLPVGTNGWAGGVTPLSTGYPEPYQGFASWSEAGHLAVELVFTEAGLRLSFTFAPDPAQLTLVLPANPGLERRVVIGRPYP